MRPPIIPIATPIANSATPRLTKHPANMAMRPVGANKYIIAPPAHAKLMP